MATAPLLAAREGRPVSTLAGAQRSLERARLVNLSLREQLRAERAEGAELATTVRQRALRMHYAVQADLGELALHEASAIAAAADRFLRQRSSGAL